MNNYLIALLVLLAFGSCKPKNQPDSSEKSVTLTYEATDAKFANPERGFYKHTSTDLTTGGGALTQSQLTGYRDNNITLILRVFYLKKFKNSALSQAALDEIEKDFETARKAGVKLIVRFAYSSAETEPDAPLTIVLQHLEQLKPVFERNADMIATVQAGLIGAWGEGYYSTNGLNSSGARYEVYKKLLEVVPESRTIQVRTPAYKQEFFKRAVPLSYEEAFKGTDISRVGHHNDCFLASTTDYGTYLNPDVDKAYLNKECLFVPIGGETCPPSGVDPATSTKAQADMRYLRWSYLNEDYYRGVNDQWIVQGGMDNIIREMGYRLQLLSGKYSNKVQPGGAFHSLISIKNTGYAPLYNPRLVELILKNKENGERFKIVLDVEPRFWQPLQDNEIEINAGIPDYAPAGNYDLYLHLPDPEPDLYGNPAYSIRLANDNVWEESTGYNNLNVEINISSQNNSKPYPGSLFFEKIED
ncbi:MAG: DUF4832 domain-containing protein [Prevotellaceae bacterium]|jgi:hypothetical protein|nr:DUF4832 domain-containing protein [Prevotellaceae bacterium]